MPYGIQNPHTFSLSMSVHVVRNTEICTHTHTHTNTHTHNKKQNHRPRINPMNLVSQKNLVKLIALPVMLCGVACFVLYNTITYTTVLFKLCMYIIGKSGLLLFCRWTNQYFVLKVELINVEPMYRSFQSISKHVKLKKKKKM